MKAKVLISFTDKHTGKVYPKGKTIELTAARFNEITRKGRYIEVAEETGREQPAENTEIK